MSRAVDRWPSWVSPFGFLKVDRDMPSALAVRVIRCANASCEPEIASVGLSEAKAAEIHGKENITSAEFNVAGNARSQILGTQGFVKLVSLKDGPIVGFHAIGARMGEQVGEGQLIVNWEADASDVAALVHAHPTQNETIGEAAMVLAGKPLHNHG